MSYYAVHKGVNIGIYNNWKECQINIKKYPGAIYKKFNNLIDAEKFVKNGRFSLNCDIVSNSVLNNDINEVDIYTDGSFFIKDGFKCGGYGIHIPSMNVSKSYAMTTNKTNIRAELSAVNTAIKMFLPDKNKQLNIYTDSRYCILIFTGTGLKYKNNNYLDTKGISVRNSDLVAEAMRLLDLYNLKFFHVYSHTNKTDKHSLANGKADKLAVWGAMDSYIKSLKSLDEFSLTYGKYKGVSLKNIPKDYIISLSTSCNFEKSCSKNERYRVDKEIIVRYIDNLEN